MVDELFALMGARRGHFALESGHHGELWLDVDRLFVQPDRVRRFVRQLAERLAPYAIDAVCGPLTGGAFLALLVADQMGVDFSFADRRVRRGAAGLFPVDYPVAPEFASVVRGRRVAIVNDVINAGSAVRGALASLGDCGAAVVAIGALLVLGDFSEALAADAGLPLEALTRAPNAIWRPAECPLCCAGIPLAK